MILFFYDIIIQNGYWLNCLTAWKKHIQLLCFGIVSVQRGFNLYYEIDTNTLMFYRI